ncbi:MAG: hypothetical protein Q8N48_01165 [Thiobacillus sp.]|nr:hypothetical protein [Thiobacillus sp.]MDP2977419.1 hypothetical protein [Thiobacillus sp.]
MGKRLVIVIQNAPLCTEDMLPDIERGSMKLLAGWIDESDQAPTF